MKLATFTHEGVTRIGVVRIDDPNSAPAQGQLVDLSVAAPDLPREMTAFLSAGQAALESARAAGARDEGVLALSDVRLESPVLRPSKFLAIGLNYADHIEETGMQKPEFPMFFNKQVSSINGPFEAVHAPRASRALDYEGELGFVIGRRCRHVPKDRAHEVIAGYVIGNDVTIRDWQRKAPTMILGKGWDTHGPLGPWLTTSDEVPDPHTLDIKTWVNGDLRQDSNTRHLIFDCYSQIETLSTVFTLEPGDVVLTGTSSGVGYARDPREFMKAGDVVRIEVEGLGHIENRIVSEPENAYV